METFKKCLKTLHESKSDNEKLAALMVISKITQVNNSKTNGSGGDCITMNKDLTSDLYSAVSSTFLLRLLKTSSEKDANAPMFHQLALHVLSVVARVDITIVLASDDGSKILSQFVLKLEESATSKTDDRKSILELFALVAADKTGCTVLMNVNNFVCIVTDCLMNPETEDASTTILNSILTHGGNTEELLDVLCKHSEVLVNNQEIEKFSELELLSKLLKLIVNANGFDDESKIKSLSVRGKNFLRNLTLAAEDLLKSRLKAEYKQMVISLVSNTALAFDVDWIFEYSTTKSTFCILVLTSVSVELACLFNLETPLETLNVCTEFIVKSFDICKSLLVFICSDKFEDSPLASDSGFIVNVFNSFRNTMNSVYCFCQTAQSRECALDNPILVESLSLVCVWATEETESLQDELKETIPLLTKVARNVLDGKFMLCNFFILYCIYRKSSNKRPLLFNASL